MASFNSDAGAEANGLAWGKGYWFEAEYIVAEVFTGMSNRGLTRARVKQFYAKHMSMVAESACVRRQHDLCAGSSTS
jgi:hypothetical protein